MIDFKRFFDRDIRFSDIKLHEFAGSYICNNMPDHHISLMREVFNYAKEIYNISFDSIVVVSAPEGLIYAVGQTVYSKTSSLIYLIFDYSKIYSDAELVEVILHECFHIKQFQSKRLTYDYCGRIVFDEETFYNSNMYYSLPWEIEAHTVSLNQMGWFDEKFKEYGEKRLTRYNELISGELNG